MFEDLIGKYVRYIVNYGTSVMRYEGTVISCDRDVLVIRNEKNKTYYFNMRHVLYFEIMNK